MLRSMLRFVPAFALVFAFVFAVPVEAAPSYEANFAKFGNTNGFFTIKGYRFDNAKPTGGQSRRRGTAQFSAITIERDVDARTPEMLSYYAMGRVIPKVTIRFGEGKDFVFSMELKNVSIGGVSHTAEKPKKGPTELVTLTFEEIKWSARTPGGKVVSHSWTSEGNQ